ncbi:phage major capsid protein [Deinococcus cellulosilyticus]|uniref:Phage major capsid protein n=1 Tax=Deinococcus cellulosilyticus (strain DSM 18568 / NBRC 106333 / KACC 11606 / 5516J-15) TaxID=1223518 RepID=A0A511NCF0_DEIC1|nr:phage major capsid protein [Deinococcus cellulosilyticus]GEM50021.1 hypothetical protein DC3_56560 [Deinococcus cellulosilyticus NBRC 106333 = KACC 11606]
MTTTTKNSVFIPEVLADTLPSVFAGRKALYGTGIVVVNPGLDSRSLGEKVQVPYFNSLGEFEDLATDGDELTPAELTSADDESPVLHSGKAFSITKWAQMAAAGDPYQEAANQISEGAFRRFDKALIDKATTTTLIKDLTGEATKTFNWNGFVEAKLLWGDEQDGMVLMIVHSKVYGDMLKEKDEQGRPLLVDMRDGTLPRYGGIPVAVSDRCKVIPAAGETPAKYESYIGKKGALALWYNSDFGLDTDKNILKDSKEAAVHIYYVAHLYRRCAGGTKPGIVKIISH